MKCKRKYYSKLFTLLIIPLLLVQLTAWNLITVSAAGSAEYRFASGALRQVWEYADLPVVAQKTSRSLTWGIQGFAFLNEPYQESTDHIRLVQYFDKGRMEITYPQNNKTDPYYVTSGLLVRDMVAGLIQEGNNQFTRVSPSEIPVAGDPINTGPTYRSFAPVASLTQNNKAPVRTNQFIQETLNRNSFVGENAELAKTYQIKYSAYDDTLDHNIASVFWDYMQQKDIVYQNGSFVSGSLYKDTTAVFGLPLTEAYWTKTIVGGETKDVLVQLFERRLLTYTPSNPDGYKTEMGNVGLHYYNWRYPGQSYVAPWVTANIANKSECTNFRVKLTGQDYLTIDIAAYSSASYKLGPGTYTYEVTGCEAIPFKNTVTLAPNQVLDFNFGLRKEIIELS